MSTEGEVNEYIESIQGELEEANKDKRNLAKAQLALYNNSNEDNIVKWQLNLEEEKQRLYHILKGERQVEREDGEIGWEPPKDANSVLMNDYGIDYVMGVFEAFVNRNIILSNFDEDRINEICEDLGWRLASDIHCDYYAMGFNTLDKVKKYEILIWKILLNIEAALKRAMRGEERSSLRKIMNVNQSQALMPSNMGMPTMQPQKKSSLIKPWTWV